MKREYSQSTAIMPRLASELTRMKAQSDIGRWVTSTVIHTTKLCQQLIRPKLSQSAPRQHKTRRYRRPAAPVQCPPPTTSTRQAFCRKDETEFNLCSIDAIRRIDLFHQGHVLRERDIDTLHILRQHPLSLSRAMLNFIFTHTEQRGTMLRRLHNLQRRVIAHIHRDVRR